MGATATLTLCIGLIVVLLYKILHNYYKQIKFCRNYPTYCPLLPIIGHGYVYFGMKGEDILTRVMEIVSCDSKHRKLALVIGNSWTVWYYHPEPIEEILSSTSMITKSDDYDYFVPWLGTGLLLSTNQKWHSRRKLLTPAFHFRILEDAMDVFNAQGKSPYCDTISFMVHVLQQRQIKPMLQNETLFGMTQMKKDYDKSLQILKDFTQKVISEKRSNLIHESQDNEKPKGRLAFLDLIMQAKLPDGSKLTDADIQEEVDTFMFEGHDTTACAISWSLYLLGKNPEAMKKVFDEQMEVFDGDLECDVTQEHLSKMKYLDCCIKEALRLYPSVPIIARKVQKDTIIDGQLLEAGSGATVFVHLLHRNPLYWEAPEVFMPERFLHKSNRHAYAYIPFSAGPRNCIGQKFAQMEEKTILSHLLRRLHFESMDKVVKPVIEIITRPKDGINSKIS